MNRSQKIKFNKARKLALNGDFTSALPIFENISDEKEESANSCLAQIYGFLFDWENCLKNAGRFIANPQAAYAGNIFNDMISLLGRAGREMQNWKAIEEFCDIAIQRIQIENYQPWAKTRYIRILDNLKCYAKRRGKGDQELVKIFGHQNDIDKVSDEQKYIFYENAVRDIGSIRPDLSGKSSDLIRHQIALAYLFRQPQAAASLFLENESLEIFDFDFLIPIFKHLITIGETEKTWQIIKRRITGWIPCDLTQIVPVALLTDEDLITLINPERALAILQTPRG